MTCVAFQAVREYIVGKTAPVPVKIYDYYEPGVPLMNILTLYSLNCEIIAIKFILFEIGVFIEPFDNK